MKRSEEILNWLRTTCEDENDHTCEPCFQGQGACENKYLADIIEANFFSAVPSE